MSKQRDKEKDFKTIKIYTMTFRFAGSLICAYFVFQCLMDTLTFFEEGKTSGAIMFLVFTLILIYLAITLFLQGLKISKAKKLSELP